MNEFEARWMRCIKEMGNNERAISFKGEGGVP